MVFPLQNRGGGCCSIPSRNKGGVFKQLQTTGEDLWDLTLRFLKHRGHGSGGEAQLILSSQHGVSILPRGENPSQHPSPLPLLCFFLQFMFLVRHWRHLGGVGGRSVP